MKPNIGTAQLGLLDTMITVLLDEVFKDSTPTGSEIRDQITDMRNMDQFKSINDETAEKFAKEFEARHAIHQQFGDTLKAKDFEPWLEGRTAEIDFYYWKRYRQYLMQEEKLPNKVLAALDQDTDSIVGHLQDPELDGPWDRRGLVLGHVQSGKTANYTGMVCKAADAGYKLIVIIAGVNNNLRNQTQARIDEGFTGTDNSRLMSAGAKSPVGVGLINDIIGKRPNTFTSTTKDFNRNTAGGIGIPLVNMNTPAIFVIKKNSNILKNLINWLKAENTVRNIDKIREPMLIIDDEADNASINTKKGADEVARINSQIRTLLQLFDRSCYVGYTATPFANIFIDPDRTDKMLEEDLFPRHFIVSIDPPSNYIGPDQWFLDPSNQSVLEINDHQTTLPIGHKKDHMPANLPPSLKIAIRQFVVSESIRRHRDISQKHSSMLINSSVYNLVQNEIRAKVHDELTNIKDSVSIHAGKSQSDALKDHELKSLYDVWEKYFQTSESNWNNVQQHLHQAAAPIRVEAINSKSAGSLDYRAHASNGLQVIAIGGYALSRGLTLEGLSISYYLRRSLTSDTMMQMCRWFGYRDGYEDLCKVWMPLEAKEWYAYIAESMQMLREELREMSARNETPEQFGLKVRTHPDNLLVTARNKMGSATNFTLEVDLSEKLIESYGLKSDQNILEKHRSNFRSLISDLNSNGTSISSNHNDDNGYLIKDVSLDIVRRFLQKFNNNDEICPAMNMRSVLDYIDQRSAEELSKWDVLITSLKTPPKDGPDTDYGFPINYQERKASPTAAEHLLLSGSHRLSGRGIATSGLTQTRVKTLKDSARNRNPDIRSFPDHLFFRGVDRKPLIAIHLIKPRSGPSHITKPVIALSLIFPKTNNKTFTQYIVTTTWFKQQFQIEQDEEELNGDE